MAPLTYTAQEVAQLLGVSTDLVYAAARRSEIPHKRMGGRIIFPKRLFDTWLDTWEPRPTERPWLRSA